MRNYCPVPGNNNKRHEFTDSLSTAVFLLSLRNSPFFMFVHVLGDDLWQMNCIAHVFGYDLHSFHPESRTKYPFLFRNSISGPSLELNCEFFTPKLLKLYNKAILHYCHRRALLSYSEINVVYILNYCLIIYFTMYNDLSINHKRYTRV